ncbi:MAG TPA: copper amine oxidase N-terminal domain-containing protein [Syntrophomonadaceae bacterium]|nr:copper amine oxidase N-terminal domain-containing protein [Syntrophomonadaceae bacterium]
MKKPFTCLILAVMMLTLICVPAQAEETPTVFLDGQVLSFDVPPMIIDGRTMVPLRGIFEAMGAKVSWDADTNTATGEKDGIKVIVPVGSIFPTINGVAKTLDVPAQIVNGRTLAPLRFVGEAFGGSVSWNADTQTVNISSSVPLSPFEYATYTNARFDYSMPYPNIFDASMESDNGDGVTMETAGGLHKLKIWGAYNSNQSTAKNLLAEANKRVSNISSQNSDEVSYHIEYLGGGDGQELVFSEHAFLEGDKIIGFTLTYPIQDRDKFVDVPSYIISGLMCPITQDTIDKDFSPLIKAICLSESLHYDSFNAEPDNVTTTYTLFKLVSSNEFSWNNQLQAVDGDYYFSNGPESENADKGGGTYMAPQLLYQDFFTSGTYKYPPADLGFLIEGTQTGIAVHLKTIPVDVDVEISSVDKENNTTKLLVTVSRISDQNKNELLGDAVITLKQDSASYFGYTIVSYKPLYSKFDDMKLQ